MSDRAIVATGTWLLGMVLIGTLAVGPTPAFYAVMVLAIVTAGACLYALGSIGPHNRRGTKEYAAPRRHAADMAVVSEHGMSIQARIRPQPHDDTFPTASGPSRCARATVGSESDFVP